VRSDTWGTITEAQNKVSPEVQNDSKCENQGKLPKESDLN
jgi:hypothetical protein